MEKQVDVFTEEARELLDELEASLLQLEERPDDVELIDRVFRAMHTIKGSASMFGFDNISDFTHHIESVFDLVRDGKVKVNKHFVDLSLTACDQIKKMIAKEEVASEDVDAIENAFREMIPDPSSTDDPETPAPDDPEKTVRVSYRIRFRPYPSIFTSGGNPMLLLDELRELGECNVIVQIPKVMDLETLDPETCQVYWDVILTTPHDINAIQDVFIFVEDQCDLSIDVIDDEGDFDYDEDYKRIGEILIERGDINTTELKKILASQKRVGQLLVESNTVSEAVIESALAEQEHIKRMRKARHATAAASSLRIASDKLDQLVDLVGELVTVQARLTQKAADGRDAELLSIAEEVERLTSDMRDKTMGIRMLPIGASFSKFKRVVRDLSAEIGKSVALVTEGGETELDKTVIERLSDPLIHIIRNCIDHGIEAPEKRVQAGKPAQGTIRLSAEHSGAHVLIRIADDGQGLDTKAIRSKALAKGLIPSDANISTNDLYQLIFAPGFSTVEDVSDLSGRGVGMDVVRQSIDALRGSVEIKSAPGEGVTITLKLPLTLAIIDGLMVKINSDHYVIPLSSVEECIELTSDEVQNDHGRHIVNLRGRIVPYLRLRELFWIGGKAPEIEMIVITEVNGERIGFVVDRVLGEHQTVIKGLGRAYRNTKGLSGATIMGDGEVALILDLPELVHLSELDNLNN